MSKYIDITNRRFGGWIVEKRGPNKINGRRQSAKFWCRCVCGTRRLVLSGNLLYGSTKSCGCIGREKARVSGPANKHYKTDVDYKSPYRLATIDGKSKMAHWVVMEQMLGRWRRPGESVHHINGNKLDNRPENLELWSHAQPSGQRVEDKTAWAIEWLKQYKPEVLK